MRLVYDIGIRIYYLAALLLSPWKSKARLWIRGRKGWRKKLDTVFSPEDRVVWFHCASLGEFEQGRPVIEALRKKQPQVRILLTFFSPSGYEKRKDYKGADHVMYLPLDTARNARILLRTLNPEMAVFIKYEFWFHFLNRLRKNGVPVYLASGIFRPGQVFFRWYGGWYRRFLDSFTHIFVQQESSRTLLAEYGLDRVTVAGDTRFDRVGELVTTPYENQAFEKFSRDQWVIVAGSTWEADEQLLESARRELPGSIRWIIAPHELSESHLQLLEKRFPDSIRFTHLKQEVPEELQVVIVDTIGQLSYLYRYGTMAYIGGGFGKGIHNILEAATYGLPVCFGPRYGKFSEALELVDRKGAFPVENSTDFVDVISQHQDMNKLWKTSSEISSRYVKERLGATETILNKLFINH